MARKKKGRIASFKRSVSTRKRRNPDTPAPKKSTASKQRANELAAEFGSTVLPALGGYAAGRLAGRIATGIVSKKSVRAAKHAAPLASTALAASWYIWGEKIKALEFYHGPIWIGAAIAAAQNILQTYIPQWSWILNDTHIEAANAAKQLPAAQATEAYDDGSFDDEYDYAGEVPAAGRSQARAAAPASPGPAPVPEVDEGDAGELDDVLGVPGEEDDLYAGVFAGGFGQ